MNSQGDNRDLASRGNDVITTSSLNSKILVIDDEPDIAILISKAFARYGFNFDMLCDPQEALERFKLDPQRYILVVVDVRMPGMNGLELVRRLREIRSDIKVLYMTAYLAEEIHTATDMGVYKKDVIEKPFSLQLFCAEIRKRLVVQS